MRISDFDGNGFRGASYDQACKDFGAWRVGTLAVIADARMLVSWLYSTTQLGISFRCHLSTRPGGWGEDAWIP